MADGWGDFPEEQAPDSGGWDAFPASDEKKAVPDQKVPEHTQAKDKPYGVLDTFTAPAKNAWAQVKKDIFEQPKDGAPALISSSPLHLLALAASPLAGVIHGAVTAPVAAGLSFMNPQKNVGSIMSPQWVPKTRADIEDDVNEALMTLAPEATNGTKAAALVKAPPAEATGTQYVHGLMKSAGKNVGDIAKAGVDAGGKPITGAEAIGRPGITATRALGLREGTTGDSLEAQLAERAQAAPSRIKSDFAEASGVDPDAALGDIESVVKQGRIDADPLYKSAFEGSGSAPFEKAFEQQNITLGRRVNEAQQAVNDAGNKMTLAEAKMNTAGDNVYLQSSARQAVTAAQRQTETAEAALEAANTAKESTLSRLQQAQADRESGVKGGIWSPRLQQFLDNREFKAAMAGGLKIQEREALKEGIPFNPRDYAVTGTDSEGMPIVNGVPNMRLLDAAKRGLDQILKERANSNHGVLPMDEDTKSLLDVKNAYLKELDNLNPDYKAARASSSDYLSAQDAFNRAYKMFGTSNYSAKQVADFLERIGPTNARAAKSGAAKWFFDQAEKGQLKAHKFTMPVLKKKLESIVSDPQKTAEFLIKMDSEAGMAKAGARMTPGLNSTTFESGEAAKAQDNFGAASSGAKALYHLFSGHPVRAAGHVISAAGKAGYAFGKTSGLDVAARNEAGKLLMLHPSELASRLEAYEAAGGAQRPLSFLPGYKPRHSTATVPLLANGAYHQGNNK